MEPKRQALAKANQELKDARDKLKFLKDKLSASIFLNLVINVFTEMKKQTIAFDRILKKSWAN